MSGNTFYGPDGKEIVPESPVKRAREHDFDEHKAKRQKLGEVSKFRDLPIPKELKETIEKEFGYEEMTEIQVCTSFKIKEKANGLQKKSILPALENEETDIIAQAKTGSGKTIAFLVPSIVHLIQMKKENKNIGVGVLVLAPTRELAMQIESVAKKLVESKPMQIHGIKTCTVTGGASKSIEVKQLQSCNLVIATPGRCLDHLTVCDKLPRYN